MLVASWCVVSAAAAVDFGNAEYTIPSEPFRAVLHVMSATSDGHMRALTLYGDGRLELVDNVLGASRLTIEREALEAVIDNAVQHGLAELDRLATGSMQRMLLKADGSEAPVGVEVNLLMGLDEYRRGENRGRRSGRPLHVENLPADTDDYPAIFELRGLASVLNWMDRMFQLAAPSAGESTDYSTARFRVPSDPRRAVLSLKPTSMSLRIRTLTLYADGRLELSDGGLAEYVRYLDASSVREVLAVAVEHGLLEFDEMAINAKKWVKFEGRPPPPAADAGSVGVMISVDEYEREGFRAKQGDCEFLHRDFYGDSRHFPEIPQFRGVMVLLGWMHEEFVAAEEVFGDSNSTN